MSGPVSTNEIEDFVSSVRRLVSVDARPRPTSRDLASNDQPDDQLVLTPAFRVVAEMSDAEPLILTVPVRDVNPGFDAASPDPTLVLHGDHGPAATVTPPAFEAEWEEELWAEPEPPLAELALGAEEAEVVVDPAPAEPAPAEPGVARSFADAPPEESPWAEVGDDWLEEDAPAPVPEAGIPPIAAPARAATRPDVLKLSAEDMLTDGDGNPLTVLDEAALQQIIRQLIREELKGVLGERITLSVRKLVRAEINRALAAHALD